mmetsp:Transcript_29717/g.94707  ORF Transcript_29717/g.94707 Transcript_29717/m.94707 type:complete len:83 (-) Transcript_29717:1024-1272(-)
MCTPISGLPMQCQRQVFQDQLHHLGWSRQDSPLGFRPPGWEVLILRMCDGHGQASQVLCHQRVRRAKRLGFRTSPHSYKVLV